MADPALDQIAMPPPLTTTDQVFAALYDAVISLKLPPGQKISEAEIAKQLNVSRQPVRDAFFRLSKLGFLSIRPQRSTLVTRISQQAVRNALFTRTALEIACLHRAMDRISADDLADLSNLLTRQAALWQLPDPAQFHASDEAFHASLCRIAGQDHVWSLIQEQKAHMDRIRYLTLSRDRRHQVLGEHQQILADLTDGNRAAAEAHLRAHIADIETVLQTVRDAHPEYMAP